MDGGVSRYLLKHDSGCVCEAFSGLRKRDVLPNVGEHHSILWRPVYTNENGGKGEIALCPTAFKLELHFSSVLGLELALWAQLGLRIVGSKWNYSLGHPACKQLIVGFLSLHDGIINVYRPR